jgi:hypothetical protein
VLTLEFVGEKQVIPVCAPSVRTFNSLLHRNKDATAEFPTRAGRAVQRPNQVVIDKYQH